MLHGQRRGREMAEEAVKLERQGNLATLTLNRPERRNSINVQVLQGMAQAFAELADDSSVRVLTVRGAGRVFCAGIDLQEAERLEADRSVNSLEQVYHQLEQLPFPTVAAVQGAAIAGGLQLALHCDFRIAAQGCKFGMTNGRVGLTIPFDLARKLVEIAGSSNTSYLLLTGQLVDSQRALEMSLVQQIVADDQLDETVRAFAAQLADNAPLSMRAMKAIIRRCESAAFNAYHEDLDRFNAQVLASTDLKEGLRAFLEKRKPVWRGK